MADLQEAYKVAAYLDLKVKSLEDVVSELSNGEDVKVVFKGHDEDLENLEPIVLDKAARKQPSVNQRSESALNLCGYCGEVAEKDCGRCPNVKYCDEKCEAADKAVHAFVCDPEPTKTPRLYRAILLEEGALDPKFVWIESDLWDNGKSVMKDDETHNRLTLVDNLRSDDARFEHSICVWYRDSMHTDGISRLNNVVRNLTKGKIVKFWRGPLLLVGVKERVMQENPQDLQGEAAMAGPDVSWMDIGGMRIGSFDMREYFKSMATDVETQVDAADHETADEAEEGEEQIPVVEDHEEEEDEEDTSFDLHPRDLGAAVREMVKVARERIPSLLRLQQAWGESVINDD
ncbi:hypothetical protein LTR17_024512 [Elasticomyces elasticus]|nr:hypothetical protein LTR17_024512 [Elasticomyces elasticus]